MKPRRHRHLFKTGGRGPTLATFVWPLNSTTGLAVIRFIGWAAPWQQRMAALLATDQENPLDWEDPGKWELELTTQKPTQDSLAVTALPFTGRGVEIWHSVLFNASKQIEQEGGPARPALISTLYFRSLEAALAYFQHPDQPDDPAA
jgi:hypothetical protein